MSEAYNLNDGLLSAYFIDRNGNSQSLSWQEIKNKQSQDGYLWLHFNYDKPKVKEWLLHENSIPDFLVEALTAEETRPRAVVEEDALLLILRGINPNPEDNPDEMIALRIWAKSDAILTFHYREIHSITELRKRVQGNSAPHSTGDFLISLARKMADETGIVLETMEEKLDTLEKNVLLEDGSPEEMRRDLIFIRQQTLGFRRYLAPQRDVFTSVQSKNLFWLEESHLDRLLEIADQTQRYVEDLDLTRDQAQVVNDAIQNQLTNRINQKLYSLSLLASTFLPTALVAALWGMNVKGIPLADHDQGFIVILAIVMGLTLTTASLLKFRKWF